MKRLASRFPAHTGRMMLAAGIGFAAATAVFGLLSPRPAGAQFGQPLLGPPGQAGIGAPAAPAGEPITVTALSATQFVVATREPRLVQAISTQDRGATYMLVPVITHYAVEPDGMTPMEDVRIPPGWRQVQFAPAGN